jgi:8-oxo-dGTP pyrophosphatase MutT (NUDIX family)
LLQAATVVLLRDGASGLECLMLRKTEGQAFGGLWTFPGGRVEEGDGAGMEGARQAAVREAAEETGLLIDPAGLVPMAHWTPPTNAPRRYLTWFFVAPTPLDAADVEVDGGEIDDHVWLSPAAVLERHGQSEIDLLPPTWITLNRLVGPTDVAAALAEASARPIERFSTQIAKTADGVLVAVWDGDVAYVPGGSGAWEPQGGTDLATPGARHRLFMDPAGWRYERREGAKS